ncbi:hypothetical protein ESOMN_v1c05000 [Williamsoniiplasma somnilux]|uniref:Uncharacterized protein n=1 Tax=Williamsoniiplasma somnilux TaxID=215578 RepID=A0A2K8NYH2_9MOLU|nr:hypothetical protein [Williamsoniiplasma somnilux]ATZ18882.1 hypothetical protein ESOMN_v1c05000 [Williamsoniiplasma somnilux]
MQEKQKLKQILDSQMAKVLNRFWYSLVLITIPLLVLVVNFVSLFTNFVGNDNEIIILIFYLVIPILFALIENIIKNLIAYRQFYKINNFLKNFNTKSFELLQTKTQYYLFNNHYKTINTLLGIVVENPNFKSQTNLKSLKSLNIKWALMSLLILIYAPVLFVAEIVYFKNFDASNWAIIFGLITMILIWLFLFIWMIPRQIEFNIKLIKYKKNIINEAEFCFRKPLFNLKSISEKLEE